MVSFLDLLLDVWKKLLMLARNQDNVFMEKVGSRSTEGFWLLNKLIVVLQRVQLNAHHDKLNRPSHGCREVHANILSVRLYTFVDGSIKYWDIYAVFCKHVVHYIRHWYTVHIQ